MSKSNLNNEQKLRVNVLLETQKICENVGQIIDMKVDPKASELISELVWKKLQIYASDLEAFAKHAKRSQITPEDVKLLARRVETLKDHITNIAETTKEAKKKK